jgi:hypothetical protein
LHETPVTIEGLHGGWREVCLLGLGGLAKIASSTFLLPRLI